MKEDTRITISRAFRSAARWQIIMTVFLASAVWLLVGVHAAASALLGGASVLAGGYAGVVTVRRHGNSTPSMVLVTLLKAEVVRVTVITLLLLAAFKLYKGLVPLALIGGLTVAVLISGAVLRTQGNENK